MTKSFTFCEREAPYTPALEQNSEVQEFLHETAIRGSIDAGYGMGHIHKKQDIKKASSCTNSPPAREIPMQNTGGEGSAAIETVSPGFTLDTYAHMTTAVQREAAETMENVLRISRFQW